MQFSYLNICFSNISNEFILPGLGILSLLSGDDKIFWGLFYFKLTLLKYYHFNQIAILFYILTILTDFICLIIIFLITM